MAEGLVAAAVHLNLRGGAAKDEGDEEFTCDSEWRDAVVLYIDLTIIGMPAVYQGVV